MPCRCERCAHEQCADYSPTLAQLAGRAASVRADANAGKECAPQIVVIDLGNVSFACLGPRDVRSSNVLVGHTVHCCQEKASAA